MKNWKEDLSDYFGEKEKERRDKEQKIKKIKLEVGDFFSVKVIPAFKKLKTELEKHGREVDIDSKEDYVSISVAFNGKKEYFYVMEVRVSQDRVLPCPLVHFAKIEGKDMRFTDPIKHNTPISDISKEDIIEHFLKHYKSHLNSKK